MSTFNYGRFVALGKRMLTKYGTLTTIEGSEIVADPDKPWQEATVVPFKYENLLSVKFDPIKALDKEGQPLKAEATFYVAVTGIESVTELPENTVIYQNATSGQRWSIVKSELIKPAETGVLWIIWVNRYA